MNKILLLSILCTLNLNLSPQYVDANKNCKMDFYENPKAKIEDRVEDQVSGHAGEDYIGKFAIIK